MRVFVSYSHYDRSWLERLQVHLKPLERRGRIDCWDDSRIAAGDRWHEEIRAALGQAEAAVLLVSADFLASDFIHDEELPRLLQAAQERGCLVLPVLLKPCRLAGTGLESFQAVNSGDRPLVRLDEGAQEDVWMEVCARLEEAAERAAKGTEGEGRRAAQDGGEVPGSSGRSGTAKTWAVPYERNTFFIGRDAVVEDLERRLLASGRAGLCGLGGIGKTQIAIEFAHRHRERYAHVLWSRATSDSDLVAGFVELARALDLPEARESDQSRAVEAVRGWLESQRDWLLILDKADEPELLKDFRPRDSAGHLLITSRNPALHGLGIPTPIEIGKWSPEEAVRFLWQRTGREPGQEREERAATDLARELGYLPLAIEQACAYITANQSRFQDYLRGYCSRRLAVLTQPVAGEYPDSVATTWAMNFREVAQLPESADLLRFSAFLAPDHIPLELIARGAPELGPAISSALADVLEDPLLLDEALEPLYRYSLVRRNVARRTYSIHPIMQTVLLDGLEPELQREWAERAVRAIHRVFPPPHYENWEACARLLPHAQHAASLIEKWHFDLPAAGFLLFDAAEYLRRRARYSEASALQEQLLALREQTLGAEHTAVAETLIGISKLAREQGRYERSAAALERALGITEKAFGPRTTPVARLLDTLAPLYADMDRLDDAEQQARRSLDIRQEILGPRNLATAKSLTNLGHLMRRRGRHAEAEEFIRGSLEIESAELGGDHPSLSKNLTILGDLCLLQERHREASAFLERALLLDEKALGDEHPALAWSLLSLAQVQAAQERVEEAEACFRRALELRERKLGARHPLVVEARRVFADFLVVQGREDEVAKLLEIPPP